MALYQKYRPKTLQELVGQEFVRQTLQASLKKNRVSHAYLFFGSRGTGKTSTARILSKALNCLHPRESGDPCNECEFCVASDNGTFIDMIEIDGASNRKIEHARALIEKINFTPTLGKRKVYIIDEVHMLTKEAFNALLKTIEEPPEHAYFLLATTELQKVPDTIRSRCQIFTFQRLTTDQIASRLAEIADKESIAASHDALLLIAKKSLGGMRDAIGLFEQAAARGDVTLKFLQQELGLASLSDLDEFQQALLQRNADAAIRFVSDLSSEGISLGDFLEQLLGYFREQMLEFAFSNDETERQRLGNILIFIDYFDTARRALKDSPIPTLPIEIAIVKATITGNTAAADPQKSEGWSIFGKKDVKKDRLVPTVSPNQIPKQESPQNELASKTQLSESETTPALTGLELTDENLKQYWPKVTESLRDPVLRVALMQSQVSRRKDVEIVLTFPAETFRLQVMEVKRMSELMGIVRSIFHEGVDIVPETRAVVLAPLENTGRADLLMTESDNELPVTDPAVISEIFGAKQSQ